MGCCPLPVTCSSAGIGRVRFQPACRETQFSVAREPESLDEPFPPGEVLVAPGTADWKTSHLPSVMVNANILTEKGLMSRKFCSGVILHQKMVVSAAHCVCAPRSLSEADKAPRVAGAGAPGTARSERAGKQGMTRVSALRNASVTSIVDASSLCVKTATVATVQYIATESGTASKPEARDYIGEVVIHRLRLDHRRAWPIPRRGLEQCRPRRHFPEGAPSSRHATARTHRCRDSSRGRYHHGRLLLWGR